MLLTLFKDNKLVREFLSKARENMKLIEEHQRLEQNASTNKVILEFFVYFCIKLK